jgi:hypothetical protein
MVWNRYQAEPKLFNNKWCEDQNPTKINSFNNYRFLIRPSLWSSGQSSWLQIKRSGFGNTLLKHGRHFDYWNQPLNMSMLFSYLDFHQVGLCCYLVLPTENPISSIANVILPFVSNLLTLPYTFHFPTISRRMQHTAFTYVVATFLLAIHYP